MTERIVFLTINLLVTSVVFAANIDGSNVDNANNIGPTINGKNINGKWCQDGEPYICYPPVQYDSDTYVCTDSTIVNNASPNSLEWIINQTNHYYVGGITSGNSRPQQVRLTFNRSADPLQQSYENITHANDATQLRRLVVKDDSLLFELTQIPEDTKKPQLKEKTLYARCSSEKNAHYFYTALVDCGGSGDYIAGVPAVVDNPLLWSQWKSFSKNTHCRVAARCWGGGWVAFAYSKDENTDNTAFGAACGGESRHDAKQQAINTCKQSGGNNCLYQVLSAFDNGEAEGIDSTNKGSKLESCYYGNCEQLRE